MQNNLKKKQYDLCLLSLKEEDK